MIFSHAHLIRSTKPIHWVNSSRSSKPSTENNSWPIFWKKKFHTKIMTVTSFRPRLTDRSFSTLLSSVNINYYYYLIFVCISCVSCSVCCRKKVLRKSAALKIQSSQRNLFTYCNLIESFINLWISYRYKSIGHGSLVFSLFKRLSVVWEI